LEWAFSGEALYWSSEQLYMMRFRSQVFGFTLASFPIWVTKDNAVLEGVVAADDHILEPAGEVNAL
jgi:hypothetical protein